MNFLTEGPFIFAGFVVLSKVEVAKQLHLIFGEVLFKCFLQMRRNGLIAFEEEKKVLFIFDGKMPCRILQMNITLRSVPCL